MIPNRQKAGNFDLYDSRDAGQSACIFFAPFFRARKRPGVDARNELLIAIVIIIYNFKEETMTEPYKSTQTAFKENPQMTSRFLLDVAQILDRGDCVEIRKSRDGTPKVIRVRREFK